MRRRAKLLAFSRSSDRGDGVESLSKSRDIGAPESWWTLFVRILIAGLLLTAALIKTVYPTESTSLMELYKIPQLVPAVLVQSEIALAALLLAGCWPRAVFIVSGVTFGLFALLSTYRAIYGMESCGCFGEIKIDPLSIAVLDSNICALSLLAAHCSASQRVATSFGRLCAAGCLYAVIGLPAAVRIVS